jgi:DNA repair exonuclease SbcCD ATPase subunit
MATTAEIHAVADKIAADGGSPTLVAVRAALGGGSFSTISEAMKLWKASRTAASAAPMREAAPAAVAERMAEVAGEVWAMALDLANHRLQAEREALDLARAEVERGRRDAIEAADTMGGQLDAAKAQLASQAAALEAGERQAAEAGRVLDKVRADLAAQADAAHVAQAGLTESRQRCEQLGELLAAEKIRATAAERATQAAQEKAMQAQEKAAEAALKTTRAEATAEQIRAELARLIEDSKSARAEASQALKAETAARAAEEKSKAALDQAAAHITALTRDIEIVRDSERQAIGRAGDIAGQLKAALASRAQQPASSQAIAPASASESNIELAPIPAPDDFDLAMTPNPAPAAVKAGGKAARKRGQV